jgi:hypothetical protein
MKTVTVQNVARRKIVDVSREEFLDYRNLSYDDLQSVLVKNPELVGLRDKLTKQTLVHAAVQSGDVEKIQVNNFLS